MADRMETIRISIARTDTPMIAAIIIMSLFEPVGTVDCVDSVVGLSLATAYSIIIMIISMSSTVLSHKPVE